MKRKTPNVKFMTLSQLQKIVDNGFMGDPSTGYGFDYCDQAEEIQQRLWELSDKKMNEELEEQMNHIDEEE